MMTMTATPITTRSSHAVLFILFHCNKQVFRFDFLSLQNLVFFLLKNDMKISSDLRSRVMAYYEYLVGILSVSFQTSCVFQTGHVFLVGEVSETRTIPAVVLDFCSHGRSRDMGFRS